MIASTDARRSALEPDSVPADSGNGGYSVWRNGLCYRASGRMNMLDVVFALEGWQPIESAPKDGTVLDLYNENWRAPMRGLWDHEWAAEVREMSRRGPFTIEDPTHWRPAK